MSKNVTSEYENLLDKCLSVRERIKSVVQSCLFQLPDFNYAGLPATCFFHLNYSPLIAWLF